MAEISVIIPCYGVEKYLDRCMESILNQSLGDIEIILVDDGSPDRVPAMCDEYARRDSRVRVVHKANGGLGFARNSGLDIATGRYVAFVDSDDFVDKDMYRTLLDAADSGDYDAVFCGFKLEGRPGVWADSHEVKERTVWEGNSVKEFMLDMVACDASEAQERRYYMSVWHAIYRRSIISDNGLRFLSEREVVSEDIPFQIDFLKIARKICYIPDNNYYYCANGISLTATYKAEKFKRFKLLRQLLMERLGAQPSGNERVNRMFIGYTRTQLHHLVSSKTKGKLAEIARIVGDPLWRELECKYPPSNYRRRDVRFMYRQILQGNIRMLYVNSLAVNFVREMSRIIQKLRN